MPSLATALIKLEVWSNQKACAYSSAIRGYVAQDRDGLAICDEAGVRRTIGGLARMGALGTIGDRFAAHRLVWEIAKALGIYPASIDALYRSIGESGLQRRFTVPAINVRAIAFESARGVFQAMVGSRAGAVIFELSRGEIGFTGQRPHEYATSILCAAIAEGHRGPVFLQGDHFQISATRFAENRTTEIAALEALIAEAVCAGFFNIDIDASTLVDLSKTSVAEQQQLNADLSAHFCAAARMVEPAGVPLSLGGEIGEVGDLNSTPEELRAYLDGVTAILPAGARGLSKISIQSGTRHGGNVLADGSFGDMPIDIDLVSRMSAVCREDYGVAGCVQHGASMLSLEKIAALLAAGCVEVHLAAAFLNAAYEVLPDTCVRQADEWAKTHFSHEWKQDWSEAQFLHHARRYPVAPFKRAWWDQVSCHDTLRRTVRERASAYFAALGVENTQALIEAAISHGPVPWREPAMRPGPEGDESGISDLAG